MMMASQSEDLHVEKPRTYGALLLLVPIVIALAVVVSFFAWGLKVDFSAPWAPLASPASASVVHGPNGAPRQVRSNKISIIRR